MAAAVAASSGRPAGREFLATVLPFVPGGLTAERIQQSLDIPPDQLKSAIDLLGTGNEVSAQDTVPFCLWSAAHHLNDFAEAMWRTVQGLGDCDTTCAIVGGIVALSAPSLPDWIDRREPLLAASPYF